MKNWIMGVVGWLLLPGLGLAQSSDTVQQIVAGRQNSTAQQSKPYVILISIDGLRADYIEKYKATNLSRLSRGGAKAEYMLASYPSLTFPNHYSMVTGLYPAHHGLVDNNFYDIKRHALYEMHNAVTVVDGSWYGGVPIWVLAEKQKMVTASFYWVGSDSPIQGVLPTYYYHFNEKIPIPMRLNLLSEWLQLPEEHRPHLIMFYFPQVDHESHEHGPESLETEQAVRMVDEAIGSIVARARAANVQANFIIVSDHGMANVEITKPVTVPGVLLDTSLCRIVGGSTLLHIYLQDQKKLPALYHQLKQSTDMDVYLPTDIPPAWHYSRLDDRYNRLGDIMLVARYPRVFKLSSKAITPGKHGFDPSMKEMHATFVAWGPAFKSGITVKPFENVNIFPLVAKVLGLDYDFPIDGNNKAVLEMLK